jgi:hypothetical protein
VINLGLEGTFQQLISYWVDLEKSPYYVNVTVFTIKKEGQKSAQPFNVLNEVADSFPDQNSDEEPKVSANFSAVIFWHNNPL